MLQELFRIPGLNLPVYGYGLMLVLGVFAAVELGRFLANRHGLNGDHFATIGLLALVSGVAGARISHVLENLGDYTRSDVSPWQNLVHMVNLSEGGLTFYGGFLLATPVLLIYAKWRNMPLRLGMDVIAPCLMVGLAFGRVGCLLNGCCWGQTCDPTRVPWAITFPYDSPPYQEEFREGKLDVPAPLTETVRTKDRRNVRVLVDRQDVAKNPALVTLARDSRSLPAHPAQLYSSFNALLIAGICAAFLTLRRSAGHGFALMLILYSVGRFTLETLRVEPAVPLLDLPGTLAWNLSFSMWTALFTFAAGAVLWVVFALRYCPVGPAKLDAPPAGPTMASAAQVD